MLRQKGADVRNASSVSDVSHKVVMGTDRQTNTGSHVYLVHPVKDRKEWALVKEKNVHFCRVKNTLR